MRAESVRLRGGKFILSTEGLPPIELAPDEIACFAPPCADTAARNFRNAPPTPPRTEAAPKRAPGHIGLRGAGTIIANLMPKLLRSYAATLPKGVSEAQYDRMLGRGFTRVTSEGALVATLDMAPGEPETAFQGVLDDKAVIGLSTRSVSAEESREILERHSVDASAPESERVIALDAVAIIVNRANPIRDIAISPGALADIFAGSINDWSRMGGRPGQITLHAPAAGSAPLAAFEDLVARPRGQVLSGSLEKGGSSADVSRAVAADVNAIGIVDLYSIGENVGLAIKNACNIPQRPTLHAAKTETYPLTRRLYAYTAGALADPVAAKIMDFIVSPAAQAAIREAGYIDQGIIFENEDARARWAASIQSRANPGTPASALKSLMADAGSMRRSSASLRFAPESIEFDAKARADIRRIAALIGTPEVSGRRWALIGFADSSNAYSSNYGLSQRRAAAAGQELANLGVSVGKNNIVARSWLNPDACHMDEEGRRVRDRRVEFWVEDKPPAQSVETGAFAREAR